MKLKPDSSPAPTKIGGRRNLYITMENNNQANDCHPINGNRPLSFYENTASIGRSKPSLKNESTEQIFEKNPTQMHCLATTVPQNIATHHIAGKHTPTRNSLRHSRMIVLNRSGQASTKYLAPLVKYYRFVKMLLALISFLGTVLCLLSLLLLLWTPNLRPRDNPYWSALPVIFSGITGFIFLYFFPRKRPDTKLNVWVNCIKFISIAVSFTAAVAAFTACGFALIHLIALVTMTCSPPDKVNTTCLCSIDPSKHSSTNSYHYVDLTCTEVNYRLYSIILFSCIINVIVTLSEILYLYVHWSSRKTYTYSQVQNTPNLNRINKGSGNIKSHT